MADEHAGALALHADQVRALLALAQADRKRQTHARNQRRNKLIRGLCAAHGIGSAHLRGHGAQTQKALLAFGNNGIFNGLQIRRAQFGHRLGKRFVHALGADNDLFFHVCLLLIRGSCGRPSGVRPTDFWLFRFFRRIRRPCRPRSARPFPPSLPPSLSPTLRESLPPALQGPAPL